MIQGQQKSPDRKRDVASINVASTSYITLGTAPVRVPRGAVSGPLSCRVPAAFGPTASVTFDAKASSCGGCSSLRESVVDLRSST